MKKETQMLLLLSFFVVLPIIACIFVIWANGFSVKVIEASLPTVGAILALLAASLGFSKNIFDDSQSNFRKLINFAVYEYKPFKIVPLTNLLKNGFLNQSKFDGLKEFEDNWRNNFVLPSTVQDEDTYQQNDPRFEEFFQAQFLIWLSKQFYLGWERNEQNTYLTTFGKVGSTGFGPEQKYTKHVFMRDLIPKGENRYIDSLPQTEHLDLRIPRDSSIILKRGSVIIESEFGKIEMSFFKNGDSMNAYQPETFSAKSVEKLHNTFVHLYPGKQKSDLLVRNFEINITCKRTSWRKYSIESEHIWKMCKNVAEAASAEFSTIEMLARQDNN